MHICNSCNRFRSYFVTDSDNTDKSPVTFGERVTCQSSIGSGDCKHTDSSVCQFVNLFIENLAVKFSLIAFFIIVIFTILNKLFGSTLDKSDTFCCIDISLNSGGTVFIGRVERYRINCLYIRVFVFSVCNELQNSSFCGVASDNFQSIARACDNGIGIMFESQCKHFASLALDFVKSFRFFACTVKEINGFKLAFCNSTCLVAEKDIQASCSFDTAYFTDKHVVIKHFFHVH